MIDRFERNINYLRISVTDLCNLRCRYCMPADGVCKKRHGDMLTEEEMIHAVRAAASLGIRKLRITGGEPLVKKNILSICERSAEVDGIEELCLTTNGILLPKMASALRAAGVKRLNISLDTLNEEKYAYITRIGRLKDALAGLDAALCVGFEKIKINVVLIGGFNDDEITELAKLSVKYPVDVRFIELMPMYDSGDFDGSAFVSCETVLHALPQLEKTEQDGGVAKLYRLPGGKGKIGLISPVSAHFCGECNRIRLTADGKIKPCLHSAEEFSVRGLDCEGMRRQMEQAIWNKPAWHGVLSAEERSRAGRNMNQIGG
ncbi:MAG: GTP 3',8-cyclase MoaA [Lachnospiraceae bacterium]|nr:GTP 3',8-cyclase MoaA [Robinsoniella sp.]MDY3765656.1 GTP 3',8-cyclase MoaA [Lachnospiraceae bacterium]